MYYTDVKDQNTIDNVINKSQLLERVDGDQELIEELLTMFVEDVPNQLKEIEEAINNQSFSTLKISAHRLKGTLGNLSAEQAYETMIKMEMYAGQEELASVKYLYQELENQITLVIEALRSIVRNNGY